MNRRAELAHLDRVLAGDPAEPLVVGITVVAGTAGVGKTSLALHWSHQVHDRFPDGQLYINLRGYDPGPPVTAEQALDHFLRALGIPSGGIPADLEARAALYRSLLAGRRFLVVLDNAANERQVRPLLPGTAGSLALITSRSRLAGLAAREGAQRVTLDVLPEDEAVSLVRAVTSGQRGEDGAAELAELAQLCARLPLALRIAAERAASRPRMTLGELIEDLRDESGLWEILRVGQDEDADAVRTVFTWSYRALEADAARAFRLLGLHPGPDFGVQAAMALTGTPLSRIRRVIDVLVGACLLEEAAPGRYQFHDLLRAYAADLARAEETAEARSAAVRHCLTWYLHTTAAAQQAVEPTEPGAPLDPLEPDVVPLGFADREAALRWFHTERANLVAAVRAATANGMDDIAWRFPLALMSFYTGLNPFEDWFTTGRLGLDAARRVGDRGAEAGNLNNLGVAYCQAGRLDEGAHCYSGALAILRDLGNRYGEAMSLNGLALVELRRWNPVAARDYFSQALAVFRELGEEFWTMQLAANMADADVELGNLAAAEPPLRETLSYFRDHNELPSVGDCLVSLSRIAREQNRPHDALPLATEALNVAERAGSRVEEAFWLLELAAVQRALNRPHDALATYHHSAVLHRQIGDRTREALAWDGTGCTYQDLDRPDDAIPFHRMAATTHHTLNNAWHEAVALHHLAQALTAADRIDDANEHRRQALALFAHYDDPRARELREHLTGQVDG